MAANVPPADPVARSAPVIALVAGEASGDNLGAALIEVLRARLPGVRIVGVAGPRMRAAGCEALADAEELAVMGLTEVLRHLPRLLKLRRRLVAELTQLRPDVFVGIDAPEFNLGLAARMKARGMRTVQYVSPQVWAWRQGRVRGIGEACDRILCLLPFEPAFYERHGIAARFVGHPLADQFPMRPDRDAARAALGLGATDTVVAVLPGSRMGEVSRLAEPFAGAAGWLAARRPGRLGRARRPVSPCMAWRVARVRSWPRRMWCWSPPARQRSRRCSASGRWWSPTDWVPSPLSCCSGSAS
jgi:lipid-A-disaccharide synthase